MSRILWPSPNNDPFVDVMERLGADARVKGLTNEAELAAHKAERIR